ncbi:MAG: GNAT family N-acetyltransferase [Terriglobales bacterium]
MQSVAPPLKAMLPDLATQALDNPIWAALTTEQAHLAEVSGNARRFPPEISPLAGLSEPTEEAFDSLKYLIRPKETIALFLKDPPESLDGWSVKTTPLLQMMHSYEVRPEAQPIAEKIIRLGAADSPEMLALAKLTKPGPFDVRTHELGNYFGIRKAGVLVSMAGERLHFFGHTEVSAVCTHPDDAGHGYAAALVLTVVQYIKKRGEVPILHVRADNARAIAVYERLGFTPRLNYFVAVLQKK